MTGCAGHGGGGPVETPVGAAGPPLPRGQHAAQRPTRGWSRRGAAPTGTARCTETIAGW